jgi:hypothetical protein
MNQKQRAAAGKILRRCTICGKFHASYLVDDAVLGRCYLCYSCWTARHSQDAEKKSGGKMEIEKQEHQ